MEKLTKDMRKTLDDAFKEIEKVMSRCVDDLELSKEKCTKEYVLKVLEHYKKYHPDQRLIVESPKGYADLKIGEALIFEGMDGSIVIDSE